MLLAFILNKIILIGLCKQKETIMSNKNISDIQKFIETYEPAKFKTLSRGIEVRGIKDIHRGISYANEVIQRLSLRLTIAHSAEMAMYGSFEVLDV